jgi:putative PEP-CTERM system histidine kinase
MIMTAFLMAWRLEIFWRVMNPHERRRSKYLVVGFFLASGSLFWCASYRLSYMRLVDNHFLLLAILLLIAWLLASYAVARNRLLNRNLFVSRKVVYSSVAPTIFAGYLLLVGISSMMMRAFGWPLHFVVQWILVVLGLLLVAVLALSDKVRSSVKYFISTNFYINKYEYRDEWLAFSDLLQGTLSEKGVVEALRRTLKESLFTDMITIWLGAEESGFRLVEENDNKGAAAGSVIPPDDPLIRYLKSTPYLDVKSPDKVPALQNVIVEKKEFFQRSSLVLLVPLAIGEQFFGFIGVGSEKTGGPYGRDDYDLLTALCSQAASALLSARMVEELAQARQKSAWDTMSSFVLHDIKNAATMLKLVQENAPAHIHKAEFQRDVLVLIDDALQRIDKVQTRLSTLKGDLNPAIRRIELGSFLSEFCEILSKRLPQLAIEFQNRRELIIHTDPVFIEQIIENLLLNALEAGGPGTRVQIDIADGSGRTVDIEITDSGPGVPLDLLPGRLFEPFESGKPNGSGIGLWQVKKLVESLGGTISAQNLEGGGAKFVVRLPVNRDKSE